MLFPDCQNDESYNYDFLNAADAAIIDGYDYCAKNAIDTAFDNIDAFPPEDLNVRPSDLVRILHAFRDWIASYIESERDELITSMIDSMDEEEYQQIRTAAIQKNGTEKYYDTRHYACTGEKKSPALKEGEENGKDN